MTETVTHTPEQVLAAVKAEAFAFGRCCDLYQDGLGTFHCHDCGQRTFAMLRGVQELLGDPAPLSHEEAVRQALIRRAAPGLLEACERTKEADDLKTGDAMKLAAFREAAAIARAAIAEAKKGT